jgi:crotonobetainyl-CoA:carnitine CoA-transferase CaiB-like acyl-CoA transferase
VSGTTDRPSTSAVQPAGQELPLAGIRVLDFTQAMAGPACSMLLADFGANVIKVEPPGGEGSRSWGVSRFGPDDQFSALYLAFNRNKASIVLDLKSEQGRAKALALAKDADVVVEGFRPGVADRLGIGYDELSKLKPDLVYCSISGFGHTGPLHERPGYDQLLQAYAGHMSITGEPDRPSVRIGPSAIDLLTGAHAAFGILVALRERDQSGRGQRIDTSLYDSSVHLVSHFIADYTGSDRLQSKAGGAFPFLAPYGMYDARDREFFMGVGTDRMFGRLCHALGRDDLLDDARFKTNDRRVEHRHDLDVELAAIFRSDDADRWVRLCHELEIPATEVATIAEVAVQEQALARSMIVETGIASVRTAGVPVKLSRTPGAVRRPAPRLGEDDDSWEPEPATGRRSSS